ncbi:MAG: hypothetical protein AB8I08_12635 [Sandaracinaceae bacterium]
MMNWARGNRESVDDTPLTRGTAATLRHAALAVALLAMGGLTACDEDMMPEDGGPIEDAGGGEDAGGEDAGGEDAGTDGGTPSAVLARPSRSATVAITEDDAVVAMVDPQAGQLTTVSAGERSVLARTPVGARPSSVVIFGTTAYVANRGDATVVRVENIDTTSPSVTATVEVGSEPTGLALSPTGARLFVAEHGEGSVGVIDTATMVRTDSIDGPNAPFAITVSNDLDADDDDELLFVPEFFGTPIGTEASDASREGFVRVYRLSDLEPDGPITLPPFDSGFAPEGSSETVMTSPNQLHSVTIQEGRLYITSISVSPAAPVRFNLNVQPVVYVVDIAGRAEVRDGAGTLNLAQRVRDATADTKLFLADTVDLAFIGETGGVAYAASRGADAVQRVVFDRSGGTAEIGSTANLQIDVNAAPSDSARGCQNPTGIVTAHDGPRAFLNCWQSRSVGIIDLSMQALTATVASSDLPTGAAADVARGNRFFHTGRARWSDNSWSSCSSCHPGGLTDNVTWAFPAGPRQSTSLDGSFSHGAGPQIQRVFNWTAVFDELHDFERNTRNVSGGVGAVTNGDCGSGLAAETQVVLGGGVGQPVKELADLSDNCTEGDWDSIDAWVRTVEPPRARRFLDSAAVTRGAALFGMPTSTDNNGGCVACHGGAGWTASRRFYTPSSANNTALTTEVFTPPTAWADSWTDHTLQIAAQPAIASTSGAAQGPPQVACVIRNVGTFGSAGVEVRATGALAQGEGGYNIPSLYGVNVGAPYLHNGSAETLEALFTDSAFNDHTRAANPAFLTTGDLDQQRADLIEFLRSIDADTPEQALPEGFDGCADFP